MMLPRTKLIEVALGYFGLKELPGKKLRNPTLISWITWALPWFIGDDSEAAWCAIAMGKWCDEAGLKHVIPRKFYRARNWQTVGKEIALRDARRGDIVVFWRGSKNGSKGHVALLWGGHKSIDRNTIDVLGGNQGNAVRISRYGKYRIIAVRRLSQVKKLNEKPPTFLDNIICRVL